MLFKQVLPLISTTTHTKLAMPMSYCPTSSRWRAGQSHFQPNIRVSDWTWAVRHYIDTLLTFLQGTNTTLLFELFFAQVPFSVCLWPCAWWWARESGLNISQIILWSKMPHHLGCAGRSVDWTLRLCLTKAKEHCSKKQQKDLVGSQALEGPSWFGH